MIELLEKIHSIQKISKEAEEYLTSISKEKTFSKGTTLIRQGQEVTKIYFVTSGCLRSYCNDTQGKEHTLQFAVKNWWISDYIAIHSDEHASLAIECLTDSNVIEFNAAELQNIFIPYPEFEPFQRKILERHVVSLQKRILNQLQLSAGERYDLFIKQYGDVEQYAANYHIASYLGITAESLSRIRIKKSK
ncbi:MAG: Crp/Fnr family transcriptional regulator [Fibrobacterales bacterium]